VRCSAKVPASHMADVASSGSRPRLAPSPVRREIRSRYPGRWRRRHVLQVAPNKFAGKTRSLITRRSGRVVNAAIEAFGYTALAIVSAPNNRRPYLEPVCRPALRACSSGANRHKRGGRRDPKLGRLSRLRDWWADRLTGKPALTAQRTRRVSTDADRREGTVVGEAIAVLADVGGDELVIGAGRSILPRIGRSPAWA